MDTNSIQYLTAEFAPAQLTSVLANKGYELSLGMQVIYELARKFLTGSVTRKVFAVLCELGNVHYVPPSQDLLLAELLQLRLGGKVLNELSTLNRVATRMELHRLARGLTTEATAFISRREAEVSIGHGDIAEANKRLANKYFRKHPGSRSRLKSFGAFRSTLRPVWGDILRNLCGSWVPPTLLPQVFRRPTDFPALNTWLNCQLHLAFISGVLKQRPDQSRLDDYRHVIESNGADLFVTHDAELRRIFPTLNPFRPVIAWDEFRAVL